MYKFIINGKFLAQPITGVQRFARQILSEIDSMISESVFLLVIPANVVDVPEYQNIKILRTKTSASIFFDQIKIPLISKKMGIPILHLCHVGSILKPDYITIHDINVEANPQWFTKKLFLWYTLIHTICAKRAKKIFTVSDFSKSEIKKRYNIPQQRIINIGNAWQHVKKIKTDEHSIAKYGLSKKNFYFSLGTKAPHKNLKWVFEYAQKHPDKIFAISGFTNNNIYAKVDSSMPVNVRFLGYLKDSEIKCLMENCEAFLFPSFYEGFGIPPLEALSIGCPVVVSDISIMHEIFGDSVHYINPNNTDVNLEDLLKQSVFPSTSVLEKYSWKKSAEKLLKSLNECC